MDVDKLSVLLRMLQPYDKNYPSSFTSKVPAVPRL